MANSDWITVTEAIAMAARAGSPVTRATIGRWCQTGKVPASRVGRAWSIYAPAFRRLLDERAVLPAQGRAFRFPASPIAGVSRTAYAVYRWVVEFKTSHDGVSPTLREISAGIGLVSSSDIAHRLQELERAGLIKLLGKHSGRRILISGGQWLPPNNDAIAPNKQGAGIRHE